MRLVSSALFFISLLLSFRVIRMGSTDYMPDGLEEPVEVAKYLFTRLNQVGIRSVHGLAGDYNLASLDYVSECGLRWVGNVNELNAGECCLPQYIYGNCTNTTRSLCRRWVRSRQGHLRPYDHLWRG